MKGAPVLLASNSKARDDCHDGHIARINENDFFQIHETEEAAPLRLDLDQRLRHRDDFNAATRRDGPHCHIEIDVGDRRLQCHAVRRLSLVAVCNPFGEEIDAGLRPGTFPSRRRRRHDGAANPANAIEDRRRMGLYIIVTCQVERLAHPLNIPLRKKRPDVGLEAGQIAHSASSLPSEHFDDVVERTVGQTFSDAYGYDPVDPIVVRGVPLEQCYGQNPRPGEK